MPGLILGGQLGYLGGDHRAAGAELLLGVLGDAGQLTTVTVRPLFVGCPYGAGDQLVLHPPADRRRGRPSPVQGPGVERAPRPVVTLDAVQDGVVHVQLRVAVTAGVLQEAGHDPPMGIDPPPGRMPGQRPTALVLRHGAVVPGAAVPGLVLEIFQGGGGTGPHRVLNRPRHPPVPGGSMGVSVLLRAYRGCLKRGMQDARRLVRAVREVEEHYRLALVLTGLDGQLLQPLRSGVRLGGRHRVEPLLERLVVPGRRAQVGLVLGQDILVGEQRVARVQQLPVQQLHHVRLDLCAALQTQARPAGSPGPHTGRLTALGDR